jgi:hypothetical protein
VAAQETHLLFLLLKETMAAEVHTTTLDNLKLVVAGVEQELWAEMLALHFLVQVEMVLLQQFQVVLCSMLVVVLVVQEEVIQDYQLAVLQVWVASAFLV